MTALLTELRLAELCDANIGDLSRNDDAAGTIRVRRGKGSKERIVPVEAPLLALIENYLDSRAARVPPTTRAPAADLTLGRQRGPLFVGRDGERLTRGTLQSRVRREFRLAGPAPSKQHGAPVHRIALEMLGGS